MLLDGDVYVGEGHMGCLVGWPAHFLLLRSSIFFSFLLFFLLHADVLHFLTLVWRRLASCLTCQSGKAVLSHHASPFCPDNHDNFHRWTMLWDAVSLWHIMSIYHNVFISTSRGTTLWVCIHCTKSPAHAIYRASKMHPCILRLIKTLNYFCLAHLVETKCFFYKGNFYYFLKSNTSIWYKALKKKTTSDFCFSTKCCTRNADLSFSLQILICYVLI